MSPSLPAPIRCEISECQQSAVIHITHFRESVYSGVQHLCPVHGENFAILAKSTWHVTTGSEGPDKEPVPMLLESIAYHDGYATTAMILREQGGDRLFILPGDYYTAAAISQSLQQGERPGSHHAMAMILAACGASLLNVIVTNCDSNGHFHTAVSIKTASDRKTIDVRPSDALSLAHVCQVPIMVSPRLLRKGHVGSSLA